jgi:hypothetical protein
VPVDALTSCLLGTCHLIVIHGEIPFDEEVLVVWIEDGSADVLAGEGFDRCPVFRDALVGHLGVMLGGHDG